MRGVTQAGAAVFVVDDRQNILHGTLARRESATAVVDLAADARRGVTRRVRAHARYVFADWTPGSRCPPLRPLGSCV